MSPNKNNGRLVNYHLQQMDCCYGQDETLCKQFAVAAYVLPLGGLMVYCRKHAYRIAELEEATKNQGVWVR